MPKKYDLILKQPAVFGKEPWRKMYPAQKPNTQSISNEKYFNKNLKLHYFMASQAVHIKS